MTENILVVGATGFLGPALVEELSLAGFKVTCGVRDLKKAKRQLPFKGVTLVKVDLNADTTPDIWLDRLHKHKIDRIINNVGIATSFGGQSIENVNVLAPLALFRAMQSYLMKKEVPQEKATLPRVIQISTTGVDWPDYDKFAYPASKAKVDKKLASLQGLNHIIIRPNIIYEPERGHLLLEQIARMPINFFIGDAQIQPIHSRELAIGVARLFTQGSGSTQITLRACGPTPMTWEEIFSTTATALKKDFICSCSVPLGLAQMATKIIQLLPAKILLRFGILSKMDPETIFMMTRGSIGNNDEWLKATDLNPIFLDKCYRNYQKGTDVYLDFIEQIRHSSKTTVHNSY